MAGLSPSIPSQSGSKDDSDTESTVDYPLSGAVSEPSLDATSVGGENGDRIRPEKLEQVTEEDKSEALRLKSEANKRFVGKSDLLGLLRRQAKYLPRGACYPRPSLQGLRGSLWH
jgi:hypothetical protein